MGEDLLAAYHRFLGELTAPGAPFEMAESEVNGSRIRTFLHAASHIAAIYDTAEREFGDRALATEDGETLTVAQTMARARCLGAALQERFEVRPGDRVGIICRNRPEWFSAFIGITRIGGVAVLFNSRASADELANAASDLGCRVVIADDKRAVVVRNAGITAPIIEITAGEARDSGPTFAELVAPGSPEAEVVSVERDAPVAILFTSGTTGRPKGAVLTHRNLAHLAYNLQLMTQVGLRAAAHAYGMPVEAIRQMAPPLATLLIFPMFHVSGLTGFFLALQSGGLMVTMPRWDATRALDLIEQHAVTFLTGPALVLSDLLDQPNAAQRLAHITSVGVGGQSTPGSLAERLARALPIAQQGNGWGMTELSGSGSAVSGALFRAKPTSCGPVSPVMDIRVVDESGTPLCIGEVGELCARGPMVMKGYWNAPEATAEAIQDGWLRTGDIGRLDEDGFVYLVDRKKDMVISGGENIYCAEVERVLSGDERLSEVALFGVADPRLGERAVAAVTVRDGCQCTADELLALVGEALAKYKVPSEIVFDLGPLPRNVLSKVDKAEVRARYLARVEEAV